jgi:hypothetical protein
VTQQRCRVCAHTVHHSTEEEGDDLSHGGITRPAPAVAETEKKEQSQ